MFQTSRKKLEETILIMQEQIKTLYDLQEMNAGRIMLIEEEIKPPLVMGGKRGGQ